MTMRLYKMTVDVAQNRTSARLIGDPAIQSAEIVFWSRSLKSALDDAEYIARDLIGSYAYVAEVKEVAQPEI